MAYRKLNKASGPRKALLRGAVTSLLTHERIRTTETRAKEIRIIAEEMITLAKQNDLSARRQAVAVVQDKDVVRKLFNEIAPRYETREGGYTRILKIGPRRGDAAPMVILELV